MKAWRRLDVRLVVSHAVVAVIGVVAVAVVVRLTAPGLFDDELRRRAMAGASRGPAESESTRRALIDALDLALVIGAVVAVVAAVGLALLATRRLLGPLRSVRSASTRMVEGDYAVRVPEPEVAELAELAADVNRLGAALEATERRRAELVSDLAHELRTPLTTVRGFLEGVSDGIFEPTPEVLSDLGDEVARLERLVGDLALLSRADEGALLLEPVPLDVAELVEGVTSRLGPQFDDKGVRLEVRASPAPATLDRDRVTQLLTNVIGNALAYTPTGGAVTVDVSTAGSEVVVTVADTGRGIAADELPLVFDRFHRHDRSGRGAGIGLTVARGLARAHGGDVTATSEGEGRGSTFVIRLPVAGPGASAHATVRPA